METYTFNDVLIEPKYSEIRSRKDVNISTSVGNIDINIPILSANMKSITGPRMAAEIKTRGALGVLHRFNSIEESVSDFKLTSNCTSLPDTNQEHRKSCIVSIGVNGDNKERFQALYNVGARYFCIDIAHGHSIMMKETIDYIKSEYNDIFVIAGNIATSQGYLDLGNWGANAVKVGIGPGAYCQTRTNTGVGVPQLWALENIYNEQLCNDGPTIIADGGIKTIGDITKALKFADQIMLGSFFSGCMETPGNVYKRKDGSRYKVHGGSAAGTNKGDSNNRPEFVEGVTEEVNLGDHVKFLLREIKEGIQSACSYVGASNLIEYKEKCNFIKIGSGGKVESKN